MAASHQHPDTLPNTLSWAGAAACRGIDVDEFFTESKLGIAHVKRICGGCLVREQCLAEALRAEDGSRYGIYGGLTPAERAELADAPPRTGRPLAPCGTPSAYDRHVKNREPIDDACRAAKTGTFRRLRSSGSTVP